VAAQRVLRPQLGGGRAGGSRGGGAADLAHTVSTGKIGVLAQIASLSRRRRRTRARRSSRARRRKNFPPRRRTKSWPVSSRHSSRAACKTTWGQDGRWATRRREVSPKPSTPKPSPVTSSATRSPPRGERFSTTARHGALTNIRAVERASHVAPPALESRAGERPVAGVADFRCLTRCHRGGVAGCRIWRSASRCRW
jgi:hypothetical protein